MSQDCCYYITWKRLSRTKTIGASAQKMYRNEGDLWKIFFPYQTNDHIIILPNKEFITIYNFL